MWHPIWKNIFKKLAVEPLDSPPYSKMYGAEFRRSLYYHVQTIQISTGTLTRPLSGSDRSPRPRTDFRRRHVPWRRRKPSNQHVGVWGAVSPFPMGKRSGEGTVLAPPHNFFFILSSKWWDYVHSGCYFLQFGCSFYTQNNWINGIVRLFYVPLKADVFLQTLE